MAILPTDIRILFTNDDIIAYFLNLASCSEHFINIKDRILATFDINKKKNSDNLYAFNELIDNTSNSYACYFNSCNAVFLYSSYHRIWLIAR
jgi:hypothetical protein